MMNLLFLLEDGVGVEVVLKRAKHKRTCAGGRARSRNHADGGEHRGQKRIRNEAEVDQETDNSSGLVY